jgi:hypothetical protein
MKKWEIQRPAGCFSLASVESLHWWPYKHAQSLDLLVNWSPLYQLRKIVHLAADLLVQHHEMTLVPDWTDLKRSVIS